jgi:hypothetical protein
MMDRIQLREVADMPPGRLELAVDEHTGALLGMEAVSAHAQTLLR